MSRVQGVRPFEGPGVVGAALFPIALFAVLPDAFYLDSSWLLLGGALWLIGVLLVAMAVSAPDRRPLAAVSITVFGAVYAGGLPAFLLWLRHAPAIPKPWAGTWLLLLPLVVTWVCDTLAMAGGALIGGAKLAPVLSPKKTWAGAVSGLVGAVLAALLYGHFVLPAANLQVPIGGLLAVGLVIGTLGQAGDIAESLFKREAGIKDSGAFFPGHGGVLDRLDSLYWGIPLTVIVLRICGTV